VRIRYYIDPVTGRHTSMNMGLARARSTRFSITQRKTCRGEINHESPLDKRRLGVILSYAIDPWPESVFVITAYELRPKAKRAVRRRVRKK